MRHSLLFTYAADAFEFLVVVVFADPFLHDGSYGHHDDHDYYYYHDHDYYHDYHDYYYHDYHDYDHDHDYHDYHDYYYHDYHDYDHDHDDHDYYHDYHDPGRDKVFPIGFLLLLYLHNKASRVYPYFPIIVLSSHRGGR